MPVMTTTFRMFRLRVAAILLLAALASPKAMGQTQASTPNDRARFLAALPVAESSPLKKLEKMQAYREHADFLAAAWQKAQKERWDGMAAWARMEIRPFIDPALPLFYMFGGPDFLNADTLFPDAPRYILCGLEPVGRVPPFENMPEDKIAQALENLNLALKSMIEQGFFYIKEMQEELNRSEASGVLPLLYALAVRAGNKITEVRYIQLTDSAQVQIFAGDDPLRASARAVKITLAKQRGGPTQELYYFRVNASDEAQMNDSRFLRFMNSQGRGNSYLKAAMYLMHTKEFSLIRDLLLAQSASILQDDSGIPYRALSPDAWKIALYGNYDGPPSSIAWAVQPDLKKAYVVPGAAKPLSFKTSYRKKEFANLLFAIAKDPKQPQK
jgi:hypothetical protein